MSQILVSGTKDRMEPYCKAIERAGMKSVALYAPMKEIQLYDGLLLCGGGDINPQWYGEEDVNSHQIDPVREYSDFRLICRFIAERKPILGICRGMQVLNVAFGGTLIQDLGEGNLSHQGKGSADRYHGVRTIERSLMGQLYGANTIVNSYHHQAVDRIGQGFCVTMKSKDGVAEALEHTHLPIFAVQWHPERIPLQDGNADGDAIFRAYAAMIQKSGTV